MDFKLGELKLDDESLTDVENVILEKNLARTKGFLIGATLVGGSWLGAHLYKKFKQRKAKEIDPEEDESNKDE